VVASPDLSGQGFQHRVEPNTRRRARLGDGSGEAIGEVHSIPFWFVAQA
jgi:hypothetical protein